MRPTKLGELKHAARRLGVTSTTLREHGWKTASPALVEQALATPPTWLTKARDARRARRAEKQARARSRQRRSSQRAAVARELGISIGAVRDREVEPGQVAALLQDPPLWLLQERKRWRRHLLDQERLTAKPSETEVAEAWMRALKDGGDTDKWAADTLRFAGIWPHLERRGR